MTIQDSSSTNDTPDDQPLRYRGLSGAVIYGAFLTGVFVVLGLVLGSLVGVLTGNGPAASLILRRLVLLGLAVGLSAAASMLIGRSGRDRLWSLSVRRGD